MSDILIKGMGNDRVKEVQESLNDTIEDIHNEFLELYERLPKIKYQPPLIKNNFSSYYHYWDKPIAQICACTTNIGEKMIIIPIEGHGNLLVYEFPNLGQDKLLYISASSATAARLYKLYNVRTFPSYILKNKWDGIVKLIKGELP